MTEKPIRFTFRINAPGPNDLAFNAIVHIVPAMWTTAPDETPLLSENLMSAQEIEDYVQTCKDEIGRSGTARDTRPPARQQADS